LTFLASKK